MTPFGLKLTPSVIFSVTFPDGANHNTVSQLTNHKTFCISEGGSSSKQELNGTLKPDWEERSCNNAISRMKTYFSTLKKKNLDFIKGLNRTSLKHYVLKIFCCALNTF